MPGLPQIYLPDSGKPFPGLISPGLCPEPARDLWRGLSLAWLLNASGEGFAEDVSGNGLHGVFGSHQTAADWGVNDHGPHLRFLGNVNDVVTVADPAGDLLDNTSQLTIEIMFRFTTLSARAGIVGKYQAATGARSWLLYYEPSTLRFQVSSDGVAFEAQNSAGFTWSTGTWYHTIVRFDAGAWTIDVNGASVSTDEDFSTQTSIYGGTKELHVGQRWGTTTYTDPLYGDIASLRIWRGRVLEDDLVERLFDDPWEMYRVPLILPYPAADHGAGATPAGPWQTWGEVDDGVQVATITGLTNGVSYDVRAITSDTSGNESSGSTPVSDAPEASPASWRGVREPVVNVPAAPYPWRHL